MIVDPDLVQRFHRDLARLAGDPPGRLGVAVSGGPDSLALLILAHAAYPDAIAAATVDHGLRPESGDEAAFVAGLCASWGVIHVVLQPHAPISGNLQSAARAARYDLLETWRRSESLDWLLTGHHADDQAETLLMRLNRGSGIAGLAGIRAANGRVLRPLLSWRRAELEEIVAAAGITPVDDPSNVDERFDRARLRARLSEIDWLEPARIAHSAAVLAEAEEALAWSAGRLWKERAEGGDGGWRIDVADLPDELRRRLVLAALASIDPDSAPRGEEVQRLMAALERGGTATLGGAKFSGGPIWRAEPAPQRRSGQ